MDNKENPPPYTGPQGHPPPQGGYPPPQGGYPPPQGGYPPPQGGYYPPPQGYYPPPQQQQQSVHTNNVVVVSQPGVATNTVVVQRRGVNHCLHCIISLLFWPWVIVWIILCIADGC